MVFTPLSFKAAIVATFLFVTIRSEALLKPLFNKPSAMAVPRLPPPIIAIFYP
jgi:hypothetical protein